MAVTEPYVIDAVTVGSSELSIVSGTTSLQSNATQGIWSLLIDPASASLASGDRFRWRVKEIVEGTGGTQRTLFQGLIAAGMKPIVVPSMMLMHGWDMTLQKVAGTDRAFDAVVRGVAGTISEPHEIDGVSVGSSAISIPSGTTSLSTRTEAGIYQVFVDPLVGMVHGDECIVQILDKVHSGGTQQVIDEFKLYDAQAGLFCTPIVALKNGWDVTLRMPAGGPRNFDASIRKAG